MILADLYDSVNSNIRIEIRTAVSTYIINPEADRDENECPTFWVDDENRILKLEGEEGTRWIDTDTIESIRV